MTKGNRSSINKWILHETYHIKEGVKTAHSPGTFRIVKKKHKGGQRQNQHFLHVGLQSNDNKPHHICM